MKSKITITYYYDIVSIQAWVLFERFLSMKRQQLLDDTINLNLRPVHSATLLTAIGNPVPYSTPSLRKNYFEEQRLNARMHGLKINTPENIIDNILDNMMNSIMPQLALNYISSEQGQSSLIDLSRAFWRRLWVENKSLHTATDLNQVSKTLSIDVLQEKKYCQLLNSSHNTALEEKCFGIPWTTIKYADGSSEQFFGSDRWPLICKSLGIPCKMYGGVLLPMS